MQYVNYLGQPVSTMPQKAPKRVPKPKQAKHYGWVATGFSPEQIARAKRNPNFNLESFLRNSLPTKLRSKPYFSASAAQDACDLAAKAGWLACRVIEKKVE